MIVDETMRTLRADTTTIRILRGDHLEVTAWAGMPDDVARRLPSFRQDEGWPGEVIRTGRAIAWSDVRSSQRSWLRALRRRVRLRWPAGGAADPSRAGHRRPVGGHAAGARVDRRRHRVHQHPGDACRDRTVERRADGADRDAGRPARDAPGGLRPDEPGRHGRAGRPDRRRGDAPDHRLPQRPGLPPRTARPRRPDRLRRVGRRLRAGRHGPAAHPARRGLHRLGRPARRADPGQRRQRRPARPRRSPGPTRSTSPCSSCRCATTR